MFKTIYFTTTCMVISLTVFVPNQSAQAIPQLTSPENMTRNIYKFHLVNQRNYANCPTNSPRSCTPGGSR
jgi:hypothetical protein